MKWLLKDIPSLEEDKGFIKDCLAKNIPFSKTSMREHQFGKRYAEAMIKFYRLVLAGDEGKGDFTEEALDHFHSVGRSLDRKMYDAFSFLAQWMFEENGSFFEVGTRLFNQLPDSPKPENAYLDWQFELFRHGTSFQFQFPKYDVLVYYHPSRSKSYGLSTPLVWDNVWSNFCIQLPSNLHKIVELEKKEDRGINYSDFLKNMWCNAMGVDALSRHEQMFGKVGIMNQAENNQKAYEAYSNQFLTSLGEYGNTKDGKQMQRTASLFEKNNMQMCQEQIIFLFQSKMLPPEVRKETPDMTRVFTVCMTDKKQLADFVESGFIDPMQFKENGAAPDKVHGVEPLDERSEQEKKENKDQNKEMASAIDTILKILAFCSKDEFIEKYKPAPIVQKKKAQKIAPIVTPQTRILLPKKIIYYLHSGEEGHGSDKAPHTRKAHWRPIYKKDSNRKRLRDGNGNFVVDYFTPVQSSVIHSNIYNGPYNPPKTYLIDEESNRLSELLKDRQGASKEAISKTIEKLNKRNKHKNT
jgi:hypothetical protein